MGTTTTNDVTKSVDENTRKHMDYIQAIVTRMNTNSFQLKVICISVMTALLTLGSATKNVVPVITAFFPAVVFWFLDGYYLQQERKFRAMYNDVAGLSDRVAIRPFEMPLQKYRGGRLSYASVLFSKTIIGFYFSVIVLLGIVACTLPCILNAG